MIVRSLDSSGDWTFGKGKQDYLNAQNAIMLNIRTRLYEFLNDAFWNVKAGADWPRLLGTPGTKEEITLTCRSIVLQSYGVKAVNTVSSSFYPNTRNLILSLNINTIYTSDLSIQLQLNIAQIWGN